MLSFRLTAIFALWTLFIWLPNRSANFQHGNLNNYTFWNLRSGWAQITGEGKEISMNFEDIIDHVLDHEGGYVNDPKDLGGETKNGIAKRWYPEIKIKDLTLDQAKEIYYQDYWIPSKAEELPKDLRATYFDMCVNLGKKRAVKILQESVNSTGGPKLDVDGVLGPKTIQSSVRASKERIQAYRCLFYGRIVENNPDQKRFYYGWFKRANSI